jgi:hypothetical protein
VTSCSCSSSSAPTPSMPVRSRDSFTDPACAAMLVPAVSPEAPVPVLDWVVRRELLVTPALVPPGAGLGMPEGGATHTAAALLLLMTAPALPCPAALDPQVFAAGAGALPPAGAEPPLPTVLRPALPAPAAADDEPPEDELDRRRLKAVVYPPVLPTAAGAAWA